MKILLITMINSSNTEGRKYNPKLVMKFKDWINYKINTDELIIAASHVPFVTPTGKIKADMLSYLPLGLHWKYYNLSFDEKDFFLNNHEKKKSVWINFNKSTDFQRRSGHKINRTTIYEMLEKKRKYHFCDFFSKNSKEYYKLIGEYKYVVSPEGNGIDTHRHYDALYAKSIPIVEDSFEMKIKFQDLPVLWTKDYSELDKDYLESEYKKFLEREYNFNKLFKSYYSHVEQKVMEFNFSYWNWEFTNRHYQEFNK